MKIVNKTKILFIVTQSEFGGAQRYVFEVARSLKSKHKILVAAGKRNGELFRKLKAQNLKLKTFRLKHLKRNPWPWEMISAIIEIFNILRKEKPDILFLCSTTTGLLGSISAYWYKILKTDNLKLKTIYRIGGWAFRDPRPFWQNKIILLAEKLTAPLKDIIIVNSEVDRKIAIKHKICSSKKIVKVYNGINPKKLKFLSKKQARQKLSLSTKSKLIVGTVANFYKTKGLTYLIESINLIKKKEQETKDVSFVIIGDGRQRPELESLIKKYNLKDQVFLLGRIPDAYKYLKAFDVFVLPSLKEGFPWIILETMAAEVPIIATKTGALPEIIKNNKHGVLIEPKNSQVLAEKILWLLNHKQEAKNMNFQAGQKIKREFSLKKMVVETEKILTSHSKVH